MDLSQVSLDDLQRELVKRGNPREIKEGLHRKHQQMVFDREHAKEHPSAHLVLAEDAWAHEKAHMLDGGGVEDANLALDDGTSLAQKLLLALDSNNQAEYHRLKSHVVKTFLKSAGHVRALQSGAIVRGPHANPMMDAARWRQRVTRSVAGQVPPGLPCPARELRKNAQGKEGSDVGA